MAYQVFLSYSTTDLKTAESVKRILESATTSVFFAERSVVAGESLPARIKEGIADCDLFLLLWSRHSKESEWVRHEIGVADGLGKVVLPLVLDRQATLPEPLRHVKYLAVYENPEKAVGMLRANVFSRADRKQQQQGLAWLALGVVVMFLAAGE